MDAWRLLPPHQLRYQGSDGRSKGNGHHGVQNRRQGLHVPRVRQHGRNHISDRHRRGRHLDLALRGQDGRKSDEGALHCEGAFSHLVHVQVRDGLRQRRVEHDHGRQGNEEVTSDYNESFVPALHLPPCSCCARYAPIPISWMECSCCSRKSACRSSSWIMRSKRSFDPASPTSRQSLAASLYWRTASSSSP